MEDGNQREWPPTDEKVRRLVVSDESRLLEFKQEWYDLERASAKAEMIRDLLALANSAYLDAPALLVVGVQDRRHGGASIGIGKAIDLDQMVQVFSAYATPVPDFRLSQHEINGALINVIGVFVTPTRPYYPIRDLDRALTANAFYIRRGSLIGQMTAPEILTILAADAQVRGGGHATDSPLLVGFVEKGAWSGPYGPIVRVANITDTRLSDVDLVFDVRLSRDPTNFTRIKRFGPLTLEPRESKEAELDLRGGSFYVGATRMDVWNAPQHDKWLDVTARVRFRDVYGMLREVTASTYVID
jgi:hypothetical protein